MTTRPRRILAAACVFSQEVGGKLGDSTLVFVSALSLNTLKIAHEVVTVRRGVTGYAVTWSAIRAVRGILAKFVRRAVPAVRAFRRRFLRQQVVGRREVRQADKERKSGKQTANSRVFIHNCISILLIEKTCEKWQALIGVLLKRRSLPFSTNKSGGRSKIAVKKGFF